MRTLIKPLLFSLVLFVSACTKDKSSNVNQDRIYQDLQVTYDVNTDKTSILAQFKFGGATGTFLELDSGAMVRFNGDLLPFNQLLYGHYKEYAGRIDTGAFVYTNVDGKVFTNAIPLVDTIAFPATLDTIRKSSAYDLKWEGSVLKPDETVGLFIGSGAWGKNALYLQDADGASNLVLGTGQLTNLPIGASTLYMERSITKNLSEKTSVGGKIASKYRAKNKSVQIVD